MHGGTRRTLLTFALIALASLTIAAPVASAVVPETEVAGASAKWFSGSLLQQPGLNCSTAILGESYTEIMVSGIAAYGGAPGGGVPAVGQRYWTSFLISIPGNPCGSGSSLVQTELVLPPGTSVDSSAPIRCFGEPRNSNTFVELTGGSWSAFGGSGPYCPSAPGPAVYNQGALSFGYRPLASGQLFQIFVPVKSTQQLVGAGTSPADGFRWLTNATGVYANPGLSTVWANVFPAANSGVAVRLLRSARRPCPFWKFSRRRLIRRIASSCSRTSTRQERTGLSVPTITRPDRSPPNDGIAALSVLHIVWLGSSH